MPYGQPVRAKPVSDPISTYGKTGWCIELHDLAASKLAAYREKDREFVRLLLIEKMIEGKILDERIGALNIEVRLRERLYRWLNITLEELHDL